MSHLIVYGFCVLKYLCDHAISMTLTPQDKGEVTVLIIKLIKLKESKTGLN